MLIEKLKDYSGLSIEAAVALLLHTIDRRFGSHLVNVSVDPALKALIEKYNTDAQSFSEQEFYDFCTWQFDQLMKHPANQTRRVGVLQPK